MKLWLSAVYAPSENTFGLTMLILKIKKKTLRKCIDGGDLYFKLVLDTKGRRRMFDPVILLGEIGNKV